MADPSIRLSGTAALASSSTCTVAITGTPADGELILAVCQDNENPPFASPSIPGFSVIASITSADWNPLYVLGKIASSEGTNPTYTSTWAGGAGGLSPCMGILVIQNANSSLPTNAATTHDTSASTTFSIPAITTTKNGSLDLVAVTHDGNVGSNSNNYSAWGSSLVEVIDFSDFAGTSGYAAFGVAAVTRASAGSQAATTVTSVANDKNVAIRIEIEPAAAGGSTTNKTLSVTVTSTPSTPSLVRSVGKVLSVTVTSTPVLSRTIGKALSVTVTASATLTKSVGKLIAAVASAVASLAPVFQSGGTSEPGKVTISDAPTAQATVSDSRVAVATLSDAVVGRAEVTDG